MTTFIGTLGLLLLLSAFVLNQLKILNTETRIYNLLNIAGGGLLSYYAITLNSIPFLILELVWALFALFKLIVLIRRQ